MKKYSGPLFVAAAALLWATDNLARVPATGQVDPMVLVLFEHLLGFLIILPIAVWKLGPELFMLKPKEWLAAILFGIGGAALGNLFYTEAVHSSGASVPILIQKLQPILVVAGSVVFLKEKPVRNLFPWALVALVCVVLLSFPNLDVGWTGEGGPSRAEGLLWSLAAVFVWGASTLAGKYFLRTRSPLAAVFWRWALASLFLTGFAAFRETHVPWETLSSPGFLALLMYLSVPSGVVAMWIYYRGLKILPASVATFIELLYPLGGAILSWAFLRGELSFVQLISAAVLLLSVLLIAIPKRLKS